MSVAVAKLTSKNIRVFKCISLLRECSFASLSSQFSSKQKHRCADGNYSCDSFGLRWTHGCDGTDPDWLNTPQSEALDMNPRLSPSFGLMYVCFPLDTCLKVTVILFWLDMRSIYHIRFIYLFILDFQNVLDELEIRLIYKTVFSDYAGTCCTRPKHVWE